MLRPRPGHRGLQRHTGPAVSPWGDLCPQGLVECSAVIILKFLILLNKDSPFSFASEVAGLVCVAWNLGSQALQLRVRLQHMEKPPGSLCLGQGSPAFRGFKGWSRCPCNPQAPPSSPDASFLGPLACWTLPSDLSRGTCPLSPVLR